MSAASADGVCCVNSVHRTHDGIQIIILISRWWWKYRANKKLFILLLLTTAVAATTRFDANANFNCHLPIKYKLCVLVSVQWNFRVVICHQII